MHLIPGNSSDTAIDVSHDFLTHIFKQHGIMDKIFSDTDPNFTSKFCDRLTELCGVKLNMSYSSHPKTAGASEVMNRMVENYLR